MRILPMIAAASLACSVPYRVVDDTGGGGAGGSGGDGDVGGASAEGGGGGASGTNAGGDGGAGGAAGATGGAAGTGGKAGSGGAGMGGTAGIGGSGGMGGIGGTGGNVAAGAGGGGGTSTSPTCEAAAMAQSYTGCEFWPTVTANQVWSIFDFAVVVANPGGTPVDVVVQRGGVPVAKTTVAPNASVKVYLPWVNDLKGPDADASGNAAYLQSTVGIVGGAYRLTATAPVTVAQLNAVEYGPMGGPPGKIWSSCPGGTQGCVSASNDASLLFPTTSLTSTYRVASQRGWSVAGPTVTVTSVQNGTNVKVKLGPKATLLAGASIAAAGPGQVVSFVLNGGDVVELVGAAGSDFSGSLIKASDVIQVIAGLPCDEEPDTTSSCGHIEESVPPAETMGKHYLVATPTGPKGTSPGHVVRIYGNVDGTHLTYGAGAPATAPATIDAGAVIDLGVVTDDFELIGDHEVMVGSLTLGHAMQDPGSLTANQKGNPTLTFLTPVTQFRKDYVFAAPDDYDVAYVDIVAPDGTQALIDGQPFSTLPAAIGASGYGIARVKLGAGQQGAHAVSLSNPAGLQVMGFGPHTGYLMPAGRDLRLLAAPPVGLP